MTNKTRGVCFIVLICQETSEESRRELLDTIATLKRRLSRWTIDKVTLLEDERMTGLN